MRALVHRHLLAEYPAKDMAAHRDGGFGLLRAVDGS